MGMPVGISVGHAACESRTIQTDQYVRPGGVWKLPIRHSCGPCGKACLSRIGLCCHRPRCGPGQLNRLPGGTPMVSRDPDAKAAKLESADVKVRGGGATGSRLTQVALTLSFHVAEASPKPHPTL